MGLRELAAADAQRIMGDAEHGFGWPMTLTTPDGEAVPMTGFSTDIHLAVDPQTGQYVSGQQASVALHLFALQAANVAVPFGVTRRADRPWLVTFDDIGGMEWTFKVSDSHPDRGHGAIVMTLEAWRDGVD